MIKIICIGNIKESYLKDAIKEYQKRISKYTKLEIIELKDEKDSANPLSREKETILKHIKDKDNVVLLEIEGQEYTSEEFAKFIEKELSINSNITFIIGSSNGLDNEIKQITNKKISFSKMTFPHQLFRVILLEQIYRAFKIVNNEKYHK
jgi:23S rRNA (pseudouridine1915-N3)-methyltransferase